MRAEAFAHSSTGDGEPGKVVEQKSNTIKAMFRVNLT